LTQFVQLFFLEGDVLVRDFLVVVVVVIVIVQVGTAIVVVIDFCIVLRSSITNTTATTPLQSKLPFPPFHPLDDPHQLLALYAELFPFRSHLVHISGHFSHGSLDGFHDLHLTFSEFLLPVVVAIVVIVGERDGVRDGIVVLKTREEHFECALLDVRVAGGFVPSEELRILK